MASESEVRAALRGVEDPQLARSIVELGMVKGVSVRDGLVLVDVALRSTTTTPACASPAACATPSRRSRGFSAVEVQTRAMDPDEVKATASILKGAKPLMVLDATAAAKDAPRRNPFTDNCTRVLAVSSGKGGVGKSSVTTNLSIALAQLGHKVAALDADVWGFSMPRMLGVDARPARRRRDRPSRRPRRAVISMGFFAREDQAVVWRGPMHTRRWSSSSPTSTGANPTSSWSTCRPGRATSPLSMAQFLPKAENDHREPRRSPRPQKVALRAAAMARKVNLSVIGVVENMSWFARRRQEPTRFRERRREELADDLKSPVGQVPLVPSCGGRRRGRPIVVADPDDEASVAFAPSPRRSWPTSPRPCAGPSQGA